MSHDPQGHLGTCCAIMLVGIHAVVPPQSTHENTRCLHKLRQHAYVVLSTEFKLACACAGWTNNALTEMLFFRPSPAKLSAQSASAKPPPLFLKKQNTRNCLHH